MAACSSFTLPVSHINASPSRHGSAPIYPSASWAVKSVNKEMIVWANSFHGSDWQDLSCKQFAIANRKAQQLGLTVMEFRTQGEPPKVMISGPPASGKGTQCELIKKKYNLVHISVGDLLRAEVAAGTEYGKKAKDYMDQGKLVPDEVVVTMVKERLAQDDVQEKGWLLDGYPRSLSQAEALEALNIRPLLFLLLEVPDEILVERVVGRRLDPLTGNIYHLKYSPPESPEIAARLIQRSDDTEEKVKVRLQTYQSNVNSVISVYEDVIKRIDGNRAKDVVFAEIENLLAESRRRKVHKEVGSSAAAAQ